MMKTERRFIALASITGNINLSVIVRKSVLGGVLMKKMTDGNFNNGNGSAAADRSAALASPDADQRIKAGL